MNRDTLNRLRSRTWPAGLVLLLLMITGYGCGVRPVELVGGSLGITLNGRGEIRRLIDIESGRNNHLRTVMIGEELVQYGAVSTVAPWRLLDCQRGAFGTRPAAHPAGETIAKLADHAYRVFLTDADLGIEMAGNIAAFFNETGVRQISFDGLEGNRSTGMGNYGEILFTSTWYEKLAPEIQHQYIADASRTSHYFWHIYTRMNWGEPWYAGFRESQTEYRLKNQAYFRRNLMPGMLGWFQMRPNTSIEDIEWMLARSAAFDAGYAFVTRYATLEANGYTDRILAAIGLWERARMAGAFSADQKRRMEDISAEFNGLTMRLDIGAEVRFDLRLPDGWSLKYEGGDRATLHDATWRVHREVVIDPEEWRVRSGDHTLGFDCVFAGGEDPKARIELRILEPAETIMQ